MSAVLVRLCCGHRCGADTDTIRVGDDGHELVIRSRYGDRWGQEPVPLGVPGDPRLWPILYACGSCRRPLRLDGIAVARALTEAAANRRPAWLTVPPERPSTIR